MFATDQPCSDPQDDQFGFSPFAEQLAKAIAGFNDNHSLVLALYGPWGSGKSTLINFIRHYLTESETENKPPLIMDFNPWWFSGSEDLIRDFFVQLKAKLPLRQHQKLKDTLAQYADVLGHVVDATGLTLGLANRLGKAVKQQSLDIVALKQRIIDAFKKLESPILVIIDDIDRLHPYEVCQLLALVKALADFPKLVYLLAFDREQVAAAINTELKLDGERYLEKIVQVPFEIPAIAPRTLRNYFEEHLIEVIKKANPPDDLASWDFWKPTDSRKYNLQLRPPAELLLLVRVPRDVFRFINTFRFTYSSLSHVVNAKDFWGLEMFRVFVPDLYRQIRNQRVWLCQDENREAVNQLKQDNKESLQQINSDVNWDRILQALFHVRSDREENAFQQRRLAHPQCYEPYFRFSLPDDTLSREEILAAVNALSEGQPAFQQRLLQAKEVGGATHLSDLLSALENYTLTIDQAQILVEVLLDIGDDLYDSEEIGKNRACWLVRAVLDKRMLDAHFNQEDANKQQWQDEKERLKRTLEQAFKSGRALACQRDVLYFNTARSQRNPRTHWGDVDKEFVNKLQHLWMQQLQARVQHSEEKAELEQHPGLESILRYWRLWSSDDRQMIPAVCDGYARLAKTNAGLLKVLASFSGDDGRMIGGEQPRDFMNMPDYVERLRALKDQGEIPERRQQVVDSLLE